MYTFCPLVVGLSATYNNQHILKHGMLVCTHESLYVRIIDIRIFVTPTDTVKCSYIQSYPSSSGTCSSSRSL